MGLHTQQSHLSSNHFEVDSGTSEVTPKILSGTAAPSVTPDHLGQLFIDTTNKNIYVSSGTTNSQDWVWVNEIV